MTLPLEHIVVLLTTYKYWIFFPIAVLEGPIITVLAGFLVSLGYFNVSIVFVLAMIGDLVGDALYYALGHWGGRRFIDRWGRYIGVTKERVQAMEQRFLRYDWKILLVGKAQPIGPAILFSAGLVRMPFGRFLFYNCIATAPKIALLETVGFYFGRGYATVNTYLDYAGVVTFGIAIVLLTAYWFFGRYINSKISG